jgi:hypothetical protein
LRGPEATYTEHDSDTSEKRENRFKSRTRNRLDLQLRGLLTTVIGSQGAGAGQSTFTLSYFR